MKRTKRYLYLLAICNSKTQYNFNFNKRPAVNFAPTNFKQAPPPLSLSLKRGKPFLFYRRFMTSFLSRLTMSVSRTIGLGYALDREAF